MTMTDLPASTIPSSRASSCSTSARCRPVVGSSRTRTPALLCQVGGELEALALAAGEGRQRLAEAEVAEPDVGQPGQDPVRGRRLGVALGEEPGGLVDRHGEHLADVAPAEVVLEHRRVEPLALAHLAGGGDAGHHPQVGVDDAGAVAVRAGALGVRAEQGRLHAVGLRERLADRVEQPGVRRRVAAPGAADRALVDRDHAVARGDRAVDERALARPGHAGHDDEHAERDVDVDVLQVVGVGAADLQRRPATCAPTASATPCRPGGARSACRWPAARRASPSKTISPPALPAPGPRSTTWSAIAIASGLCSTTSTVLPLSRSCSSRSFIRWMSCGCRPIVGSSKT